MAAAISLQSEQKLVAACLQSVRELARVESERVPDELNPFLAPRAHRPLPKVVPRREVIVFSLVETAKIHDRFTTANTARWNDIDIPIEVDLQPLAPVRTEPTKKTTATPKRPSSALALMLCGMVAGVAAGAAFLASPMGHRPDVQRTTHAIEREAGRTFDGVISASTSFVRTIAR